MGTLNKMVLSAFFRMSSSLRVSPFLLVFILFSGYKTSAQSTEVQQLLLNVEKLSQLKNILEDAKKGYTVLSTGYNAVRDISSGNFSLHEFFLDGLMLVNPEIKKYRKVLDIINYQKQLIWEYKSAFAKFSAGGNFSASELGYLGRVYKNLFKQSLDNLDELLTVITAAKLRMSDQERLVAIDRIFSNVQDKLLFLRSFNSQGLQLSAARERERAELGHIMDLY
ncbi:hypothetical protein HDF26_002311 [Pedobacter cryoconitis]|uniref:TerB family tellurite resistance protein n=1 Tax=Pedobacter cryoconitis TaxID=188932 RepID=UPI001854B6A2|nr:TerB family tellurite resistance protein [Pedobacter cryoconitis]MBB6271854.1 hypothetical protein [Pedobacter cryoconitis]